MKKPTKWAKGFFRLWIAYALTVALVFGVTIYQSFADQNIVYLQGEKYLYSKETRGLKKSAPGVIELAHTNGKPYFHIYVGSDRLLFPRTLSNNVIKPIVAKHRQGLEAKIKDQLWDSLFSQIAKTLMWIFCPLFTGLTFRWILKGFKQQPIREEVEG